MPGHGGAADPRALERNRLSEGAAPGRFRAPPRSRLLRVHPLRVELLADEPELLGRGRGSRCKRRRDVRPSRAWRRTSSMVAPGWRKFQAHLAGFVEVPDPEVRGRPRMDRGRASPARAGLRSDFSAPPRFPGDVRKSIRSTNRACRLTHDHEVWRALYRDLAGPPDPGSRVFGAGYSPITVVLMFPGNGRSGPRQEADVDQPPCRVCEELPHAVTAGRAGPRSWDADREREARRSGTDTPCFVDELHSPGATVRWRG